MRNYVIAAAFAALAVLYVVMDLSLGHWGSVAALGFIALLFVGHGIAARLIALQRLLNREAVVMSAVLESLTTPQWRVGYDPDTTHTVCCCDDDTAMCGLDVRDLPWTEGNDQCVVCEDIWPDEAGPDNPCPRCGCEGCDDA